MSQNDRSIIELKIFYNGDRRKLINSMHTMGYSDFIEGAQLDIDLDAGDERLLIEAFESGQRLLPLLWYSYDEMAVSSL